MTFGMRLVAYEPAGARIGVLPSPLTAQAGFVHDDVGALTAEYSRLALRGEVLDRALATGLEIAVEVTARDGSWVEPLGGRFVWLARQDDIADAAQVVKVTAPSYGWLLSKAAMLDLDHLLPEDHSQAGKRPFYSASAGTILATLLQENAARSGVPVAAGFTSSADSAGAAWSQVVTLYYEPGIDYRRVLTNLADQGMCDWRTEGRTLRVWNPDTVCAVDRSESVRLTLGLDLAEAPSDESLEEVAGRVLLRGDAGMALTLDNPEAPTPWGTWEAYLSQGGVSDEGTARTLVQAELDRRARTRQQYTRALVLPGSDVWPLVDYAPGDWITAPTSAPAERVRVQQVTLTMDAQGVGGSVVLNDRVLDAEIRRSRRMTGIVGGSAADGGSGARPAPQGPDKRTPAAPLGLVVDSDAYIDTDGAARGTLDAAWSAVVTATDGTALEVASYDVAMRENTVGAPWAVRRSTDETQTVIGGLPVGQTYQVKVRARGRFTTTPGVWSAPVTVTVADDVTPPAVPSTLVASVDRAVVRVTWDGKTAAGGTMPRDFDRVEIASDAAPDVPVGTILSAGGGFILVTGLPYGEPVRYRARAVDRSGNASAWSPYSNVVTPTPLVAEDIDATITAAIGANRADLDALGPKVDQAVTDLDAAEVRLGAAETSVAAAQADITATSDRLDETAGQVTQAQADITAAQTRLDAAEDLVADAITIADGANDQAADALAQAHAAQEAADQANAAASAAVQGAGNTILNWSFEDGPTGWLPGDNFTVVASGTAAHGGSVARFTATGTSNRNAYLSDDLMPPVAAGQVWLMRARVRQVGTTSSTGSVRLYARRRTAAGSITSNAVTSLSLSNVGSTWTTLEGFYTVPADTLSLSPHLALWSDTPAGTQVEFDAVELRDWTQVKAALAAAATAQAEAEAAHQAAGAAQDTADAAVTSAAGASAAADAAQAAADAAASRAVNIVANGSFEQEASQAYVMGSGWARTAVTNAPDGGYVARLTSSGAAAGLYSAVVALSPVHPGQVMRVQAWARTSGSAGTLTLQVRTNTGGRPAVTSVALADITASGTVITGYWTVPDGVTRAGASLTTAGIPAGDVLDVDLLDIRDVTEAAAALAAAQSVPVILHSTAVPSGTAPAGSTWMQHAADGGVIGQWEQTATPSGGTWVARPIRSEVIANLDVGKLTAGTSVVVEQVAQKIAASTAAFQTADIGNLFVTGTSTLSDVVAQTIAGATASFQTVDVENIFSTGTSTLNDLVAQTIAGATAAFQRADIGNLFVTGQTVLDLAVAQEFWTRKVNAQKVLASEVIIGSASNIIPMASSLDGWTPGAGVVLDLDPDTGALRVRGGKEGDDPFDSGLFAVQAGQEYHCTADIQGPGGGITYCRVFWYATADATNHLSTSDWSSNYASTSAFVTRDGVVTAPEGATWARVRIYAWQGTTANGQPQGTTSEYQRFRNIAMRPRVGTALIVDGAVKARHVGAEEIEGYHVKTNTLTADRAVLGFLDGYVITGALVQTLAAANRGVKLSESGLYAYNTSGQVTVQIDGATATITGGTVRSSATPSATDGGWQLDTSSGLRFWASRTDGSIGQGARLYANGRAVFYKPDGSIGVQITDGTLSVANGMLVGAMLADGAITRGKIADNAVGTVQIANGAVTADILSATAVNGKTVTGAIIQSDTSAVGSGSGLRINGTGANATLTVWSGSNDITINPGGGQPYIRWERGTSAQYSAYAATSNRWTLWDNRAGGQVITASRNAFWAQGATATSTASVNCRVGGSGDLYTVSSLRKDKLLIEDAPDAWADAALALRPRTWLDRASHDAYAEYLSGERAEPGDPVPLSTRIPGFVAEEVAEVAPDLCTYDDTGALTGVQYDRVPAALVVLAQRQQHQLDDLTARLTALETP